MNVIYGDEKSKRETHEYMRNFDPSDDWHVYEMAWTPEFIAWSIDNKEVRRVDSKDPSIQHMNKGQSLMMNFWTPTFESWGKGLDATDMPWYVLYDYVETYTWNNEDKNFDFHWRDDFIDFKAERWHKNDNTTFDANSTTFRASQVYTEKGHLVLKMEPEKPQQLHEGQHYRPTQVEPVRTEPTYEHTPTKGQTAQKKDEHYDVLVKQSESHYAHEHHPHTDFGRHEYGDYEGTSLYRHEPEHTPYLPYGYAFEGSAMEHELPHYREAGAEVQGAHLAHHEPVHHEPIHEPVHEPVHHEPVHHEPLPKEHAVHHEEEAHVSSTPDYYAEMFGLADAQHQSTGSQKFDGIP